MTRRMRRLQFARDSVHESLVLASVLLVGKLLLNLLSRRSLRLLILVERLPLPNESLPACLQP